MNELKHTPGPWYADASNGIWRRPPADLYHNGGTVAGDKALATAHKGWHGENEKGFPVAANARLIAAAPDLLESLQNALSMLIAWQGEPYEGGCEVHKVLVSSARAAIAKATGSVIADSEINL